MIKIATRRLLTWTAIPVFLAQVGCASRGVPAPSSGLGATLSAADRQTCEERARTQAAAVKGESVVGGAASGFAGGFVGGLNVMLVGEFVLAPLGAIWGGIDTAVDNARARRATYERTLTDCLRVASGHSPA